MEKVKNEKIYEEINKEKIICQSKIKKFNNYYLQIIDTLLEAEEENSIGYINLNNKKQIYPKIFEDYQKDKTNLLYNYIVGKNPNDKNDSYINGNMIQEILLIEQANLSQKKAIDNALSKRISIIEGPPGTGKTTTIINILANLIYRNKKVLVVSKNNSAIDNVKEELENIKIPKCYIRMR